MAENSRKGVSLKNHINISLKQIQLRLSQKNYVRKVNENQIIFCHGPAGTSKTFTACYIGLKMFAEGEIKKIVLCKPLEDSGRSLGFIPGNIDDKVAPYLKSYKSNISKIIGHEMTEIMFEKNLITFEPLAYMRGDTYDDSLMILDEAQNAEMKALMLFVTRMGKNSKCVVAGDINQYDIQKSKVSLPKFIELIEDVKGVGIHLFSEKDIVRAKILKDIVKKYDSWKRSNEK
tara:strand:+ start:4855 stop:5550 length:696 start_codon:yes stop_codon:yes gene_type:complete